MISTTAVNPSTIENLEVDEEVKPIDPRVKAILDSYKNPNIIFSHNCLAERVSKHPVLEDWIKQKIENNPRIINLTTNDWLSILENNFTFQEYMNDKVDFFEYKGKSTEIGTIYRPKNYSHNFNVIAIGTFKVTKDKVKEDNKESYRLRLVECIPVQCLAEIMCLQIKKEVFSNAKFFFKVCKSFCIYCRNNNVGKDNIWCIQKTMVYENEKLQLAERNYCTSLYPNEFKALVHLEINSAYSFGNVGKVGGGCKIGGNVESIVFIENIFDFNDSKNVKGILKTDENFVPREEYANNGTEGQVKMDENFLPHSETETENSDVKRFKNGMKRKNEEEIENDNKKVLKITEDVLAIPHGINYAKPLQKVIQVTSTIEDMPNI